MENFELMLRSLIEARGANLPDKYIEEAIRKIESGEEKMALHPVTKEPLLTSAYAIVVKLAEEDGFPLEKNPEPSEAKSEPKEDEPMDDPEVDDDSDQEKLELDEEVPKKKANKRTKPDIGQTFEVEEAGRVFDGQYPVITYGAGIRETECLDEVCRFCLDLAIKKWMDVFNCEACPGFSGSEED